MSHTETVLDRMLGVNGETTVENDDLKGFFGVHNGAWLLSVFMHLAACSNLSCCIFLTSRPVLDMPTL